MGKLIEADEVNEAIYKSFEDIQCYDGTGYDIYSDIKEIIDKIPTVEAIPKDQYEARFKTGKWIVHIKSDGEVGYFQCSSCNHNSVGKFPYCPICGAEMDCSPNILSEMEAIPKDIYETRLKADMVAMLTDLSKKIDGIPINAGNSDSFRLGQASAYDKCEYLIQQKINELKAESEE